MEAILLGSAQDAGVPQIGCDCPHCTAARAEPERQRMATSVAVRGRVGWWLLDASPDLRRQWGLLPRGAILAGVALTHAHAGHVSGLPLLGKEGADMTGTLLVSPRMAALVARTPPWRHATAGMAVQELEPGGSWEADGLRFTFHPLEHRGELSDTVAVEVRSRKHAILHLPDTDAWDPCVDAAVAGLEAGDVLVFDGTFWSSDELRRRDQSRVPHPPVEETLSRLAGIADRGVRVVLGHLNHTNPLCDPASKPSRKVIDAGVEVAVDGMRL